MNQVKNQNKSLRTALLVLIALLFITGILLAVQTVIWSGRAVYEEHDRHQAELAGNVDHNIGTVFNRCEKEISSLVESNSFIKAESSFINNGDISKLSNRQSTAKMTVVSPNKLIDDVLSMSAASIPRNIKVRRTVNTESNFLGDEGQLVHMLLNLVINAVYAIQSRIL